MLPIACHQSWNKPNDFSQLTSIPSEHGVGDRRSIHCYFRTSSGCQMWYSDHVEHPSGILKWRWSLFSSIWWFPLASCSGKFRCPSFHESLLLIRNQLHRLCYWLLRYRTRYCNPWRYSTSDSESALRVHACEQALGRDSHGCTHPYELVQSNIPKKNLYPCWVLIDSQSILYGGSAWELAKFHFRLCLFRLSFFLSIFRAYRAQLDCSLCRHRWQMALTVWTQWTLDVIETCTTSPPGTQVGPLEK